MKFLAVLGLVVAVSAVREYSTEGGYKEKGKYVYEYEAVLKPKVTIVNETETSLRIKAKVELHFLPNDKVFFKIVDHQLWEVIRDPKYMLKTLETRSYWDSEISKYLKMPVWFGYRDGMVQTIQCKQEDPEWSVNMKKGIINMFHLDITGKDEETKLKDMFTKKEVSCLGICETTYSVKDYAIWNERSEKKKIGMNITKAINYDNCTEQNFDIFNTVVQGEHEYPQRNPLKTHATIKYNVLGSEHKFKIEEVTAEGFHVFYPYSKKEESVITITKQKLRLIKEGATVMNEVPSYLSKTCGKLILKMPEFGKPEFTPEFTDTDWENMVKLIHKMLKKFVEKLPDKVDDHDFKFKPEMSELFLKIVHNLRLCNKDCHEKLWEKCKEKHQLKKWLIHAFSFCHTKECFEFMTEKIKEDYDKEDKEEEEEEEEKDDDEEKKELKKKDVREYFQSLSFNGKPTKDIIDKMEEVCKYKKIKKHPELKRMCYMTASNLIQSYYKIHKVCKDCKTWMDDWIIKALKKINTECDKTKKECEPYKYLPAQLILSYAESIGHKSFFPYLERIILNERIPADIRFKAILCCKPIIMKSPNRVRILMLRVFRDLRCNIELRQLAFSVLMENPTTLIIQLCTRHLYNERSQYMKKFVYDVIRTMIRTRYLYSKDIVKACHVCLKMFKTRPVVPSILGTAYSEEMVFKFYSWRFKVGSLLKRRTINTNSSYIPRFQHVKFNITLFGRNIDFIDAQMRIEGLQEILNKLTQDYRKKESVFDFLRQRRNVDDVKEDMKRYDEKLGIKEREGEKLKIFTQLRIFDKITYLNYTTIDTNIDWYDLVFNGAIFRAAKFEEELKKGKKMKFFRPIMPADVLYRIPTLCGIPLTFNLTSVILPRIHTEIKAEVKPSLFTPTGLLTKTRESAEVVCESYCNSLTEFRAGMYFRIPYVEFGMYRRFLMNTSAVVKGKLKFDFKNKEYKHEVEMPKETREFFYLNSNTYFYLKPRPDKKESESNLLKIRKIKIAVDQLGEINIVNLTKPCKGCRYEEWYLKTKDGKYLTVQNNKIVVGSTPEKFRVTYHGRHRHIVSLSVDKKGYVVMSRKSTCLLVKKDVKRYGKFFMLEFLNPYTVHLKTLARFEKSTVPEEWKDEKMMKSELYEIKNYQKQFTREQVRLEDEEMLEEDEMEVKPTERKFRVVYLTVSVGDRVCVTPKKKDALKITVRRESCLEDVLRRRSYKHGYCWFKSWGLKECLHGYYQLPLSIVAPTEFRYVFYPDKKSSLKKIETICKQKEDSETIKRYEVNTYLRGTGKKITVHTKYYKKDYKFEMKVVPSDKDLLKFEKFCYLEYFKPDNYSLKLSMDKECKINHLKVDLLASKHLPRHWLSFRLDYTKEKMPTFWERTFNYVGRWVNRVLDKTSLYHYRETHDKEWLKKSSYMDFIITTYDTMTMKIRTRDHTWVYKDIRLPTYMKTFPKGSYEYPLMWKLWETTFRPRCFHKNTTFVTFDKRHYNHSLAGRCEHVLLRSCSKNVTKFMVLVKKPYGKETLKRRLSIYVNKYHVEIDPREKYSDKPVCKINGKVVEFERKYQVKCEQGKPLFDLYWEPEIKNLIFYHYRLGLVVELKESWKIQAHISPMYYNKVCGLCGNYDGESYNDFTTPERKLVCDYRKPKLYDPEFEKYQHKVFADSWMVSGEKCKDECKYKSEHVEIEPKDEKENDVCLTKFKVRRCLKECTTKEYETIKVPVMCVNKEKKTLLKQHLKNNRPLEVEKVKEYLTEYKYPYECNCPCRNKGYSKDEGKDFFFFGLW